MRNCCSHFLDLNIDYFVEIIKRDFTLISL